MDIAIVRGVALSIVLFLGSWVQCPCMLARPTLEQREERQTSIVRNAQQDMYRGLCCRNMHLGLFWCSLDAESGGFLNTSKVLIGQFQQRKRCNSSRSVFFLLPSNRLSWHRQS
jgi:hypothetical protein